MSSKKGSPYKAGRPSGYANGGSVEGVSQRKAIAMGGKHTISGSSSKGVVEQNAKGHFQRKK